MFQIGGQLCQKRRELIERLDARLVQLTAPLVVGDHVGETLDQGGDHVVQLVLPRLVGKEFLMVREAVEALQQRGKALFQLLLALRAREERDEGGDLPENLPRI